MGQLGYLLTFQEPFNMRYLALIGVLILSIGCGRLDYIAFNNESIEEYKFDDWEDNQWDIDLTDPKYDIDESNIHHLILNSQGPEEATGTNIHAFYIGDLSTISKDTVIVYCHGQSAHMDIYWPRVKLLANCGGKNRFGVLEMDYRGFGLSDGTPTEEGMFHDVQACLDWLIGNGVADSNIVLYGFSLGTVPSTHLAAYSDVEVGKLILESPMASADNVAQESLLINFNTQYILDLTFNNADKIREVEQPFMWLHGTEDDYLKISNGEIIYRNYVGEWSIAYRVEGANHGHDGVPQTMGYEEYLEAVEDFIIK